MGWGLTQDPGPWAWILQVALAYLDPGIYGNTSLHSISYLGDCCTSHQIFILPHVSTHTKLFLLVLAMTSQILQSHLGGRHSHLTPLLCIVTLLKPRSLVWSLPKFKLLLKKKKKKTSKSFSWAFDSWDLRRPTSNFLAQPLRFPASVCKHSWGGGRSSFQKCAHVIIQK